MAPTRRQLAADAWGSILRVHAAFVPELDTHLRTASGMPLAWYDVLLELAGEPDGRLRLSDLADRAVLSRARISRVVDELVSAGLVEKTPNPLDKRSSYAVITGAGRERQRRAAPRYVREIESLFPRDLTNADLRRLKAVLDRVMEARS